MAKKHLNLTDIGVLQKACSIGVPKEMRGNMFGQDLETNPGNELLNTMNRHVKTASGSGKEKRVESWIRRRKLKRGSIDSQKGSTALGNGNKAANKSFDSRRPDPELDRIEVFTNDIAGNKLNELANPKTTVHKYGHNGAIFNGKPIERTLNGAELRI